MQVERFDRLEEQTGQPARQQRRVWQRQQDDQRQSTATPRQCAEHAGSAVAEMRRISPVFRRTARNKTSAQPVASTDGCPCPVPFFCATAATRTDGVVLHLEAFVRLLHAVPSWRRPASNGRRTPSRTPPVSPNVIHRRQVAACYQPPPHVIGQTGVNRQQQQPVVSSSVTSDGENAANTRFRCVGFPMRSRHRGQSLISTVWRPLFAGVRIYIRPCGFSLLL